MQLTDSMAHLDDPRIKNLNAILNRAKISGVQSIISAGIDPLIAFKQTLLEQSKAPKIYWAFGIHPQAIKKHKLDTQIQTLTDLLKNQNVVAAGEIGLDARDGMPQMELQQKVLLEEFKLANVLQLPVILHCVRAMGKLLELIENFGPIVAGGMIHGYSGPAELIPRIVKNGLHISFGGMVTYQNTKRCKKAARIVPLDKLLVESDTPDHAPRGNHGLSEPKMIRETIQCIAELRNSTPEEIALATSQNANNLFKI